MKKTSLSKNIDIATGKEIENTDNYFLVAEEVTGTRYYRKGLEDLPQERRCEKCGSNLISGGICPYCDMPIIVPANDKLVIRKNYDKVIRALYRALFTDEPLTDDELKLIIDYVMEEYK